MRPGGSSQVGNAYQIRLPTRRQISYLQNGSVKWFACKQDAMLQLFFVLLNQLVAEPISNTVVCCKCNHRHQKALFAVKKLIFVFIKTDLFYLISPFNLQPAHETIKSLL